MRQSNQVVKAGVAAIADMSLKQLREDWRRRYGEPPKHRSKDLILRVLAWRIQADAHGGFDAATLKMLESKTSAKVKTSPTNGMRLAREWQGKRYEVTVLETGIRWNGPRFFGLRESNKR